MDLPRYEPQVPRGHPQRRTSTDVPNNITYSDVSSVPLEQMYFGPRSSLAVDRQWVYNPMPNWRPGTRAKEGTQRPGHLTMGFTLGLSSRTWATGSQYMAHRARSTLTGVCSLRRSQYSPSHATAGLVVLGNLIHFRRCEAFSASRW